MQDLRKVSRNFEKRSTSWFSGEFKFDGTETNPDTEFKLATLPAKIIPLRVYGIATVEDETPGTIEVSIDTMEATLTVITVNGVATDDFTNTLFLPLESDLIIKVPDYVPGEKFSFRIIVEYLEVDLTNGQWTNS